MTFGGYVHARRKSLGLRQGDFKDLSQAYISDIENGYKKPTMYETMEKLANALKLPKSKIPWLQIYALLDRDPRDYLEEISYGDGVVNEKQEEYLTDEAPEICVGMNPAEVRQLLGPPSKRARFGVKLWWSYQDLGLKVLFVEDKVIEVESI